MIDQTAKKLQTLLFIGLVLAIFVPRLATLGAVFTNDERLWLGRGSTFIKAIDSADFEKTRVAIQPGVTTAWLAALTTPFNSLATSQAAVAITSGVLILIAVYFLSILWGWPWAFIAGIVLALDPFLIAHSRVLHTDALFSLFYLNSLLALLAAFLSPEASSRPITRYIVFSAIAAGLTLLTKAFGIWLLMTGVTLLVFLARRSKLNLRTTGQLLVLWITVCAATIFLLWPVLWSSIPETFNYLTSGISKYSSGARRAGEVTSQWWYYLREGFFRLTSIVTVLLPAGLWGLFKRQGSSKIRLTVATLLLTGLFFAIAMSIRGEKSDRYILITLITLSLTAVYGLRVIFDWLRTRWGQRGTWVGSGLLLGILLWMAIGNWYLHPYYLAHYNRLYRIESDHKLGWGEGLEQAAEWIVEQDKDASIASYYSATFESVYKGNGIVGSVDDAETNAKYVVLYRSMFERGPDAPETDLLNKYLRDDGPVPARVITINGLPYVWIFDRDGTDRR